MGYIALYLVNQQQPGPVAAREGGQDGVAVALPPHHLRLPRLRICQLPHTLYHPQSRLPDRKTEVEMEKCGDLAGALSGDRDLGPNLLYAGTRHAHRSYP